MSDLTIQAIIGGVVTVILAYMQYRTRQVVQETATRSRGKVAQVRIKVEQVKEAVEGVQEAVENTEKGTSQRLESLERLASDTHTLVNSNMGVQLEAVATALREIARLRGEPGDMAAADAAEQAYQDHERKQSVVDRRMANQAEQAKGE